MKTNPPSHDRIRIEGLRIDCIIGVYPEEALQEQPIVMDLALALDLSRAGRSGSIADTCDYDRISREVAALVVFRKFRLLENAAEEIAAMLFGLHAHLDNLWIRIEKPRALQGRARCAAVEIWRSRSDFPRTTEQTVFGEAEILLETREAGLYLLHIDAGKEIPPHYHRVMRELEWLAEGEVLLQQKPITGFNPIAWPKGEVHTYRNTSKQRATLFCCDAPPFIPEDEIVVGGPLDTQ
ncbi:MAG: dihydroneopterin aldolase [Calditrichae bacterium]|nr:dihydroneopterin aldolase [Calditrichia bacterium]